MRSAIYEAIRGLAGSALLTLLFVAPALGQSVLPGTPEYRLRIDPDNRQVHVRVEIDMPEPASIHLLFRGDWEGYRGLASRLDDLRAWGPGGDLAVESKGEDIDSGHRKVEVASPGLVTIAYSMQMLPPAESRFYHRVSQLSPVGGHLIGRDLLPRIWLRAPSAGTHPVRIRIVGMPRSWGAASVAERAGTSYQFDDIGDAVIFVGPLRTRVFHIGHRSLTTTIHGDWPVSDERVTDAIERVAGALHRIAREGWAPGDYLLGAGRVPDAVPGLSTGGQVIGRSGLVYVGGQGPKGLEFQRWLFTTAHELMHWYIPTAFSFDGRPPSWFSEGFTDYFSLKALLAGELIEPDVFLAEIGERLSRYRSSPLYGETSVADAQEDFWEDNAYRFIYDGGAVAAFLLDLGLQARGRSLERVLSDVRKNGPITNERLASTLGAVEENEWLHGWLAGEGNPDWEAELARYRLVWNGETLISSDGWATEVLSSIRP